MMVNCLLWIVFFDWFQEEVDEDEDEDDSGADDDEEEGDDDEGSEDDEDEVEPKLKYERIGNAMNTILNGEECASCMAVHTKVHSWFESESRCSAFRHVKNDVKKGCSPNCILNALLHVPAQTT